MLDDINSVFTDANLTGCALAYMGLLPISPAIPAELFAKAGRWALSTLPIKFLSSHCRVNNSLELMGARELGITSKPTLSCNLSIASSDLYGDLDAEIGATAVLFGDMLRLRFEDSGKLLFFAIRISNFINPRLPFL